MSGHIERGAPTATRTVDLLRTGETAHTDVVAACLRRIRDREDTVRAWVHLPADEALEAARRRDCRGTWSGPLAGVPVAVKDIIDTMDMPTAYGSPIYAGHRPDRDAHCVARLRAAGAVVLGKTVTTEFATGRSGSTRHPQDPRRTPGGSSSGSAAAVADRMVPVALGTQTAGSVVRPASYCGVWGLKPSWGLLSFHGIQALSPSQDTLGVFARTVEDVALLLDVLAPGSAGAPASPMTGREPPAPPRIAFLRTHYWEKIDGDAADATLSAVERLRSAGAAVHEDSSPTVDDDLRALAGAAVTVGRFDVARSLAREYAEHRALLSPEAVAKIEAGWAVSEEEYRRARRIHTDVGARIAQLLAGYDVVLTPSTTGEPPLGLRSTGDRELCRVWSFLGVPALALPGLTGANGLPIGVQAVGPRGSDRRLLGTGAWIARHMV